MKITKELLISLYACSEQVELFAKTFPNGTTVTKKACLLACEVGLDFTWASRNLLSLPQRETYLKIQGPAWKAYQEIKGQAWKAHLKIKGQAWKAYKEIEEQAWKAYKEIQGQARKAYNEKRAIAFYNACKVK